MDDEQHDIEEVKKDIRSLTLSSPHPLTAKEILADFKSFIGPSIPYEKFGFTSLEKFLSSIPDVLRPEKQNGVVVYRVVADSTTRHIAEFVEKQRKKPPKHKGARKPVAVPELFREEFKRILSAHPGGVAAGRLSEVYARETGKSFSPRKIGFPDSKSFLKAMPDIAQLEATRSPNGFLVFPAPGLRRSTTSTGSKSRLYWSGGIHATMLADQPQVKITPGLKQEIYQVLEQRPQGIWAARLPIEFQELHGHSLSVSDFGFTSVVELLSVMPDICRVERPDTNGDWMVYLVPQSMVGNEQTRQPDRASNGMMPQRRSVNEMATGAQCSLLLKENIRTLLAEHKEGLPLRHFLNIYKYRFGSGIDIHGAGFADTEALLLSLSDIVDLKFYNDKGLIAYPRKTSVQSTGPPSTASASQVTYNTSTRFASAEQRHQPAALSSHKSSSSHFSTAATTSQAKGKSYSVGERFAPPPNFQTTQTSPVGTVQAPHSCPKPSERLGFKPPVHPAYCTHHEVIVVHANSPSDFYIQLNAPSTVTQLAQLNYKMSVLFESREGDAFGLSSVSQGRLCAALYPHDHCWYRAVILSADSHKVEVFFVDYGNKSFVPVSGLRSLRPEFLELPCQALHCRLVGVAPVEKVWSQAATERLMQLTGLNKPLQAFVSGAEEDLLLVSLTDTHGVDDLHINDSLVNEGLAVCTVSRNSTPGLGAESYDDDLPPLEPLDISGEDGQLDASDNESLNNSSTKDDGEEIQESLQKLSELLAKLQDHRQRLAGVASSAEVASIDSVFSLTSQRYERLKSRQRQTEHTAVSQTSEKQHEQPWPPSGKMVEGVSGVLVSDSQQEQAVPYGQTKYCPPATLYDHHHSLPHQVHHINTRYQSPQSTRTHYQSIRPVSIAVHRPFSGRVHHVPPQYLPSHLAGKTFSPGVARGFQTPIAHQPSHSQRPIRPINQTYHPPHPSAHPTPRQQLVISTTTTHTRQDSVTSRSRWQNPAGYPNHSKHPTSMMGGYSLNSTAAANPTRPPSSAFQPVPRKDMVFEQ